MSKPSIALVCVLTATAANAQETRQDTKPEQPQPPAVSTDKTRPFDGRMRDGGTRQAVSDDHRPNAGAIIMPPKASPPARER